MSYTETLFRRFAYGPDVVSRNQSVTADGVLNISGVAVADDVTNFEFTADVSQLKLMFIATDVDDTIFTFTRAGGTTAVTLKANTPYVWSSNCGYPNIFTLDLTALAVTNPSLTDDANIEIRTLSDV